MKLTDKTIVIIFIFSIITGACYAQLNKLKYIHDNHISLRDNIKSVSLDNNKFITIGELHYKKGNYILKWDIINDLILPVTNNLILIEEKPYYIETAINNFLKTGDSTYLNKFESYYGSENSPYVVEIKKYYRNLRELYLKSGIKIIVKCIDIPASVYSAFHNFEEIIPYNEAPHSLPALNKFLRTGSKRKCSFKKAKERFLLLNEEVQNDQEAYRKYLGDKFDDFLNQIHAGLIYFSKVDVDNSENMEKREAFLYQTTCQIIRENSNSIFLGQFGIAHIPITYQKNWLHFKNWNSLAARLNVGENSPVKGKVCSIVTFYTSEMDYEYENSEEAIISKEDLIIFFNLCNSPLTIFKLDGENTPFKELSEKFQYLIINKY